jgi:hypothetical protein
MDFEISSTEKFTGARRGLLKALEPAQEESIESIISGSLIIMGFRI